jgi:hypothetical protein
VLLLLEVAILVLTEESDVLQVQGNSDYWLFWVNEVICLLEVGGIENWLTMLTYEGDYLFHFLFTIFIAIISRHLEAFRSLGWIYFNRFGEKRLGKATLGHMPQLIMLGFEVDANFFLHLPMLDKHVLWHSICIFFMSYLCKCFYGQLVMIVFLDKLLKDFLGFGL